MINDTQKFGVMDRVESIPLTHPVDIMLEMYDKVLKDSEKLANRWLNAWGDSQIKDYRWAVNLKIDTKAKTITFSYNVRDGCLIGNYPPYTISTEFIKDDTGLEKHAADWYKNDQKQKQIQSDRIRELENCEEVLELNRLRGFNNQFGGYTKINLCL